MCKAREHNAYQRVFWTSECRFAPLSGQSRIILTIEWIQCQVVVYCLYFIADNCPIWCARTIRLEAHLPVVCVAPKNARPMPLLRASSTPLRISFVQYSS